MAATRGLHHIETQLFAGIELRIKAEGSFHAGITGGGSRSLITPSTP
jgi:hypothetical protein